MSCQPTIKPAESTNSDRPPNPPQRPTRLIIKPREFTTLSSNRETDALTALKRGLKEYLEGLVLDLNGGRQVSFEKGFDVWTEPEELAVYPSFVVQSTGDATYDASGFTPSLNPNCVAPNGDLVVKHSELSVSLKVDAYCTDPEERIGIMMLLEDAWNPVDWMYGFKLQLPHYFNQIARYELITGNLPDTETDSMSRNRIATHTLLGQVSVVRTKAFPQAKPSLRLTVESEIEVC